MTLEVAKTIALNPRLVEVMHKRQYARLQEQNFFLADEEYGDFKHLGIHIADQDGINRFFSWTTKTVGQNALAWRKDLVTFYQNPKPTAVISIGKFDMTFKGTVPIFDRENRFLGIVEAITHFNSIAENLAKKDIYSVVVIDKRFNKQLVHPFSPHFIDGYRISNLNLDPIVSGFLKKYGVEYFIKNKDAGYVVPEENHISGYYVVSVPIKNIQGEVIGYYLAFVADRFGLAVQQFYSFAFMVLGILLFFYITYLVYRKQRENDALIENLDKEVERKTSENIELMNHDALTGSYSREKLLADIPVYNGAYAVLFNIRTFSKINEIYGFKIGNEVLKAVAEQIETLLSRKIYRIQGDEFVFVTKTYKKDILSIQKKFLPIMRVMESENIYLRPSFSFGVTRISTHHHVLRELAVAVRESKQMHHKSYIFYHQKIGKNNFIKINNLLYSALYQGESAMTAPYFQAVADDKAEIIPYFQAIIDNRSGKIRRYEALARLVAGKKVYEPFAFLDVAVSSGMMSKMTQKMIQKSLILFSRLEDEEVGISFNISAQDLLGNDLLDCLIEQCREYDIAPERITLEILEGVVVGATEKYSTRLEQLQREGFKLAIDDFGIEYSNFERIDTMDIDLIKIDGKYIKSIIEDAKSQIIVQSIVYFAKKLGIEVVAEYVENEKIYAAVKELGIEYSQGHYFAEPSPDFLTGTISPA